MRPLAALRGGAKKYELYVKEGSVRRVLYVSYLSTILGSRYRTIKFLRRRTYTTYIQLSGHHTTQATPQTAGPHPANRAQKITKLPIDSFHVKDQSRLPHLNPPSTAPFRPFNRLSQEMADLEVDSTGVEGAAAELSEVRLDEDGQPMSKSALKKLLKKEAADKKKAEKAATRVRRLWVDSF
jgi:hypothetical protein